MPVSTNTLFHFTRSVHDLINILKFNFRPHHSLEDYNVILPGVTETPLDVLELAIPMVSFCDIPLSSVGEHTEKYGSYAIGLTKDWGKKNSLSPVLYTHGASLIAKSIWRLFDKTAELDEDSQNDFHTILRFLKPCDGNLWRGERVTRNINFYNEREWRYVPEGHNELLSKVAYSNDDTRNIENRKLWDKYSVGFTPNDVRYLIVENEEEILPFLREIEVLKGSKYSMDEVKILTTRIISYEGIRSDF